MNLIASTNNKEEAKLTKEEASIQEHHQPTKNIRIP